jgi:hypothetical protein
MEHKFQSFLLQQTTKKLYQDSFPWNDRKKPMLRASNCFMVKSDDDTTTSDAIANKREREIKLKATKERYIESEKKRLTGVESMMMRAFVEDSEEDLKKNEKCIKSATHAVEEKM